MRWTLKYFCLRSHKSQKRVARDSELLTENRFSEIVNAWIDPSPEERAAICRALGVSEQDVPDLFDVERNDDAMSIGAAGMSEARPRR